MNKNIRDIAWAAGFFEGEGWIGLAKQRSGLSYLRVTLANCDHDVLVDFNQIIGYGKIHGPYQKPGKEIYYWCVSKHEDALKVINLLKPYLSKRRLQQVQTAISECVYAQTNQTESGGPKRRIAEKEGA